MARRRRSGGEYKKYSSFPVEVRRRALKLLIDHGPDLSTLELGRRVFGRHLAETTLRNRTEALKRHLRSSLEESIAGRESPSEVAGVRLVEGGPPLGQEWGERVHRLRQMGAMKHVFNPNVSTPPNEKELGSALKDYTRAVSEVRGYMPRHIWGGEARGPHELSVADLEKAERRYARALYWKLIGRPERGSASNEKRFAELLRTDPEGAMGMVGVPRSNRPGILKRVESIRAIPQHFRTLRGIHGDRRDARRAMLEPFSRGELRQHTTRWTPERRAEEAKKALEAAGGKALEVQPKHFPDKVIRWYKRKYSVSGHEAAAMCLHEAGLINDRQREIIEGGEGHGHRIRREILRRASGRWSQKSHVGTTGLSEGQVKKYFDYLKTDLEGDFQEVRRGAASLTDIARKHGVGVRGMKRLYDSYFSEGQVTLWGGMRRPVKGGSPPLRRDMLTADTLLEKLSEHHRVLRGSRGRRANPPSNARVRMSPSLRDVRRGIGKLLSYKGTGSRPSVEEVDSVIRDLGGVGEGNGKVTTIIDTKDGGYERMLSVNVEELGEILKELRDEVRAHQEHS